MELFNTNSEIFAWVIMPILIFISRIADQTIGTMRFIFLSKGYKYIAPILGFFEVIIWLAAVTQIIKYVDNIVCYIAYGAGFAMGNYIGMMIEERLSLGKVMLRIIPKMDTNKLTEYLKANNFGFTVMDAHGSQGDVKVIMSIIDRKDIKELVPVINKYNPHAFYSVEDMRAVKEGVFRAKKKNSKFNFWWHTKKIK